MSPKDVELIKAAHTQALKLAPEEREQFLQDQFPLNLELRKEVHQLLQWHDQAGDFLEISIPEQFCAAVHQRHLLSEGTVIANRYQIEQLIAEGGFSTVYLARDRSLIGKRVVVKVLDQIYLDKTRRASFSAELNALAHLDHRNIVGISDTGKLNDRTPFLVLNYVPGLTLREVLRKGRLRMEQISEILRGIGKALSAAHQRGISHLDLKPENVILSDSGTVHEDVTLIDFGIAQLKASVGNGFAAGTSGYMAPTSLPSVQQDIHSFALVTFEMIAGRLPDLTKDIDPQLPSDCKVSARRAISKALATTSQPGFSSVEEFVGEFQSLDRASRWLIPVAFLSAAVLVTAASWVTLQRFSTPPAPSHPVPLVATPGFEYRPSFAPDGEWLFYTSGPEGHFNIYKKSLAGGEPIPVVVDSSNDDRPQVSPNGNTLAFLRGGLAGVAVTLKDLATGREDEVARVPDLDSFAWAPDGQSLAITQGFAQERTRRLRLFDLQSRKWRDFIPSVPGSRGDMRPTFSPDGKILAFVRRWDQSAADLFVVDVDTHLNLRSTPRALTHNSDRIESVQWAPDGRSLFYVAGPLGQGTIWRVFLAGGAPSSFLEGALRVESIAIPKHEWKLAYSFHLSDTNIWRLDLLHRDHSQVEVVGGSYDDQMPRLSPDGRHLAFGSDRSGDNQIWISNADGSKAQKITSFVSADGLELVWTRDSSALIISVRSKTLGTRIYQTTVPEAHSLKEIQSDGLAVSVSRDGRWVYFRSQSGGSIWRIWKADLTNPSHVELVTTGEAMYGIESPDGHTFYFAKQEESEGIWQEPLPAGPARRVVERVFRRSLFAPGKLGLFFIGALRNSDPQSLFFRRYRDGAVSKLYTFERELFWGFDLSTDESSLLFSQFDVNNADIMLVGNFR